MSAERCPGTCGLPPAPRSAPPSRGEGGDSGTGRAALARGGGPGAGRRAVPVGRATKNGEAAGVEEDRDPAAGAGPGAGSDPGAAAVGGRWLPALGGEQRRAGRGAPCLPRLRCQGEGFAVKLLQGMTQPGSASVLAVGGGRASAVQKRCVFTNVVLPLPRLFTWSCS